MSADYPDAVAHFVPDSFMFTTNAKKAIVIHKTGGDATPADVYHTFINSSDHRSAHYAIGQDSSIWQFVPEDKGAGANGIPGPNIEAFWTPYLQQYGNLNTCTISIEHCDPSPNNDTPLTPNQKKASFDLVTHLCRKYAIPATNIKPHRSIAATTCPGNYPMAELAAFVKTGGSMTPPGWKDDGQTLTAPNGIKVVLGFRTYIRSYPDGWDPTDWPMAPEFHADPLEYSNPSLGAGQKLVCKKKVLEYTQARGVFEAWAGQEVFMLEALLKNTKSDTISPEIKQDLEQIEQIAQSALSKIAI